MSKLDKVKKTLSDAEPKGFGRVAVTLAILLVLAIAVAIAFGPQISGFLGLGKQNPLQVPEERERPFAGNPDAKIVLIEYSDFQCPACKSASPIVKEIAQEYGEQVRIEFRHFPLTSIHPNAFNAAVAAECAFEQGKFWEYHDKLFANQQALDRASLLRYAEELGLNAQEFSQCLDSSEAREAVMQDTSEAQALKLRGTPSFILNGKQVQNWGTLKEQIGALAKAK